MPSPYERNWETRRRGGRTAGDEARSSYYEIPPVHKPHWGWLIAIYFFLGGLAGGSYVLASIAELVGGRGGHRITRAGRYVSLAALMPCPVLLVLDLGRPERFHHMLRVVKLRSPMSAGVWGLLAFSGTCALSAAIQAARDGLLVAAGRPARVLATLPSPLISLLGLGPAFFLGSYTGVLLAATAVPLWARGHLFMGPLFLTSGMSNATAAITLALSVWPRTGREPLDRLERLHRFVLIAELALLAGLRVRLGPVLARPLDRGRTGRLFWLGVLGVGQVAPLLVSAAFGFRRHSPRWAAAAASALVLVGGFLLRYTMVVAGRASADDPRATYTLTEA